MLTQTSVFTFLSILISEHHFNIRLTASPEGLYVLTRKASLVGAFSALAKFFLFFTEALSISRYFHFGMALNGSLWCYGIVIPEFP